MVEIQIRSVSKQFLRRGRSYQALRGVDLVVPDGAFVSIVGASGCGKTTLLSIIAGLTPPSTGSVLVNGTPVTGPGRDRGVVFQQDALFMWRSVRRNVEYGLELQGIPKRERRRIAMEWLDLVGLAKFADFWPKELSGGMKKRCQIAVVLANDPDVLLMDEPFGALDYSTKCELQDELLRILQARPKTVFFVTHDIEEAAFLADTVVVMDRGRIAQQLQMPFARPRAKGVRLSAEFASIRQQLSDAIEETRRRSTVGELNGHG